MTEKGREEAVDVTGGGGPPRVPVKDWILLLLFDEDEGLGGMGVGEGEVESQPDAGEVASAEALPTLFEEATAVTGLA